MAKRAKKHKVVESTIQPALQALSLSDQQKGEFFTALEDELQRSHDRILFARSAENASEVAWGKLRNWMGESARYRLSETDREEVERLWEMTSFMGSWVDREMDVEEGEVTRTLFSVGDWTACMTEHVEYYNGGYTISVEPIIDRTSYHYYVFGREAIHALSDVADALTTSLSLNQFLYFVYCLGTPDEYGTPSWRIKKKRTPRTLLAEESLALLQKHSVDAEKVLPSHVLEKTFSSGPAWRKQAVQCAQELVERSCQSGDTATDFEELVEACQALGKAELQVLQISGLQQSLLQKVDALCAFTFWNGCGFDEATQQAFREIFASLQAVDREWKDESGTYPREFEATQCFHLTGEDIASAFSWRKRHVEDGYIDATVACQALLDPALQPVHKVAERIQKQSGVEIDPTLLHFGLMYLAFVPLFSGLFDMGGFDLWSYLYEWKDNQLLCELVAHVADHDLVEETLEDNGMSIDGAKELGLS